MQKQTRFFLYMHNGLVLCVKRWLGHTLSLSLYMQEKTETFTLGIGTGGTKCRQEFCWHTKWQSKLSIQSADVFRFHQGPRHATGPTEKLQELFI